MNYLSKIFILGAAAVIVCSCSLSVETSEDKNSQSTQQNTAAISSEETKRVLDHHLTSFGQNNLEEIMADYAEDAVVVTPSGTYKGLKEIEAFFIELIPSFPTEGTSFGLDKEVINDELAHTVWHAKTPSLDIPFGTDTFIIKGGKIEKQTFAGVINTIKVE